MLPRALWIVVFGLFGARAHRPRPRAITGLVVGFAGTVLLIWPARRRSARRVADTPLLPQLAILLACIVWSLGTIYMRNHTRATGSVRAGRRCRCCWAESCCRWSALARGEIGAVDTGRRPGMLSLAYLMIFSSCFAYLAYAWLARHATPARWAPTAT